MKLLLSMKRIKAHSFNFQSLACTLIKRRYFFHSVEKTVLYKLSYSGGLGYKNLCYYVDELLHFYLLSGGVCLSVLQNEGSKLEYLCLFTLHGFHRLGGELWSMTFVAIMKVLDVFVTGAV